MQTKTISKVIRNKLNEWIDTITDDTLKKELQKNVLVSGWCIASMLLWEDVNDYDVYINDIDVLKKLCIYYTKPFKISILDWRYDRLEWDNPLDKPMEERDDAYNTVIRRTLKENQIKLNTQWKRVNEELEWAIDEPKYYPKFFSPNAISLSDDLQIVCRFHWDNIEIHKTFDYIHATNYFTFEDGLVTNKEALESIITKQLKYQGSMYPLTSIIRMKKFLKRGFNISAGEILKIMFQISELNLKDPDILEEQLIGVDIAYFSTLIEILRWRDDSQELSSSYINAIIDRVFNKDDSEIDEHR